MEALALSAERPVILTQVARAKLEEARKRLRQNNWEREEDEKKQDDEKEEILERAYEDGTSTNK